MGDGCKGCLRAKACGRGVLCPGLKVLYSMSVFFFLSYEGEVLSLVFKHRSPRNSTEQRNIGWVTLAWPEFAGVSART